MLADHLRALRQQVLHQLQPHLHAPRQVGKTTLAHIIANELGASMHVTSGPALEKKVRGGDKEGVQTLRLVETALKLLREGRARERTRNQGRI